MKPEIWDRHADRYTTASETEDPCKSDTPPFMAGRVKKQPSPGDHGVHIAAQYYWPICRCCKRTRAHWKVCYMRNRINITRPRKVGAPLLYGELFQDFMKAK